MNRWLLWLPLVLFGLFFAAVATGLIMPKDNIIESKMVGQADAGLFLARSDRAAAGLEQRRPC